MTSYTIRVVNKSTNDKDFFFFTAPPSVGVAADPDIYTNTWVTRTGSHNEPIDITTTIDFYGWCGPPLSQVGKTTVKQGVATPAVTLGVKNGAQGSTFPTQYNRSKKHFEFGSEETPTADAGCYEIDTGNDFTSDDNLLIGMAMDDPNGGDIPIPVAAISADPGMHYNIGPVVMFYVAVGSNSTGDIIDYLAVSATAGVYDFTIKGPGAGMKYGEIEYLPDGTFSKATYDYNPPTTDPVGVDGWLLALIAFTQPIITDALKSAIKTAITNALQNLSYQIGPLTFSSDGNSLTVTYKLPLADTDDATIVRPFSEIFVSLDAKTERLEIKFSPYPINDTPTTIVGSPSKTVVNTLTTAVMKVPGLPSGESVTVS